MSSLELHTHFLFGFFKHFFFVFSNFALESQAQHTFVPNFFALKIRKLFIKFAQHGNTLR
jgi:hypothetical protein